MKKQRLKDDLEMMCAYADELEQELEETRRLLAISNGTVAKQIDHIAMLNRQLAYKDRIYDGLKALYKDDYVNGNLG